MVRAADRASTPASAPGCISIRVPAASAPDRSSASRSPSVNADTELTMRSAPRSAAARAHGATASRPAASTTRSILRPSTSSGVVTVITDAFRPSRPDDQSRRATATRSTGASPRVSTTARLIAPHPTRTTRSRSSSRRTLTGAVRRPRRRCASRPARHRSIRAAGRARVRRPGRAVPASTSDGRGASRAAAYP